MIVHELQALEHALALEHVHRLQDLRGVQAEDAPVAPAVRPHALCLGGELHAHPDAGRDAQGTGALDDLVDLAGALDHDEDLKPELDPQERQVDELLVLVAVADDVGFRVVHVRQGGDELRLAPGLQAVVVLGPEVADLVDDLLLLVDLDGVHAAVASLVPGVADRLLEALIEVRDGRVQEIAEAQEHRKGHPPGLDALVDLVQAHRLPSVSGGQGDRDFPLRGDVEVPVTPVPDAVHLRGIHRGPRLEGALVGHRV